MPEASRDTRRELVSVGRPGTSGPRWSAGPWMWGPAVDLGVFGGAALVALALVAAAPWLADADGGLPPWGFLLFVVALDVAHVWATLFRTYLDRAELARRPTLYAAVPLACFAVGALLHSSSPAWFWRALAYLALVHFVRQQVGWVAIYRARAGLVGRVDRWLDDAAVYLATLVPTLDWHVHVPRAFAWFVPGDFVALPFASQALSLAWAAWALALIAYVARAVQLAATERRLLLGKHAVVAGTFSTWYVGIVATNSDFTFTVANVIVHGVPYVALLWFYARARASEPDSGLVGRVLRGGVATFLVTLLALAFAEELLWDRLVWHQHPRLFGGDDGGLGLSPAALAFLVPLLSLPQTTHYVLDALLWRRGATGRAQARAMGFAGAPETAPGRPLTP